MVRFIAVVLFVFLANGSARAETVTFPASDGLIVTADLSRGATNTVIVLFHMAGASRGEYKQIAPMLNAMGYTTLAVDQRSGGSFGGVRNETAARASGRQSFLAAIPDLEAATAYARQTLGSKHVGVLGSSYSASLVLILAGQDRGFADAVMSFSPGEYFADKSLVRKSAAQITVPVFLTAARSEIDGLAPLIRAINSSLQLVSPKRAGKHGATALVSNDSKEYWAGLERFLARDFPAQ